MILGAERIADPGRERGVRLRRGIVTTEIRFHNKTEIKAQAQLFAGQTLIGTFLVSPGDTCAMPVEGGNYDIFFRNGVTGRELARKLDSAASRLTLSKERDGWFVISEG